MAKVCIALGSNLGDRRENFIRALKKFITFGKILSIAPLYRSEAYGYKEQPDFFNSVVILETELKPKILLDKLKEIEKTIGRKQRRRWGPREIDLDIIFYDREVMESKKLTVPHPDFHNRKFVLKPLVDVAPDYLPPLHTLKIWQILEECKDNTNVVMIEKNWYPNGIEL
jgi:2-amino-4-hydroxy-6-hydroxymethyldihydropteridine diphosphokinase